MPPPVTDQVTTELKLPVPLMFGEHCDVAPVAMVAGAQLGATEEMAGEEFCGGALPEVPPQDTRSEATIQKSSAGIGRVIKGRPWMVLGHKLRQARLPLPFENSRNAGGVMRGVDNPGERSKTRVSE